MTDEELAKYVGAVEKVRSARSEVVDAATRRKIAEELGMSPEDLAAAVAAGEAALTRGEGLLARSTWDEALRNLGEAETLLPDDTRVAHALARASWGRYRDGRVPADRARALAECRRCLELEPRHQGALALIAEIEPRPKRRGRRTLVVAAGLLVAGGAGAGIVTYVASPKPPRCPDGSSYCAVPAELRADDLGDAIVFAPAVLQVSPRDLRLDFSGRLTHRGATELDLFRLGVRLLDGEGREVARMSVDAQPEFTPALRPGDTRTFYLSEVVPAATRRVGIIAGERRTEPAASAYGAGQPVPVSFAAAVPSHISLRAAYRERNSRVHDGKTAVEGILELENSGQGVVRELEILLQGLDTGGEPVGEPSRTTVVYPIMPPMLPGERRTVKAFLYVAGQVASEKVIVGKVQ